MIKLQKINKIETIVKQKYGGSREYKCLACSHIFNIAVNSKEVKCFYCGNGLLLLKQGL